MNAPITIRVRSYPEPIFAPSNPGKERRLKSADLPASAARIRQRWSAEFVGGPHHGASVRGELTPDEAVGALIRRCANEYQTADELLDFFASLFGHNPARSTDAHLARAVRLAAKNPRRCHPGVAVDIQDTAPAPAAAPAEPAGSRPIGTAPPRLRALPAGKGGAA
jgi:hypothetical protein